MPTTPFESPRQLAIGPYCNRMCARCTTVPIPTAPRLATGIRCRIDQGSASRYIGDAAPRKPSTLKLEAVVKKGYLCLESEGAEIHFRKISILELPPGITSGQQTAPLVGP